MNAINTVNQQGISQAKSAKIGWIILLVVSALLMLNGLGWFFSGPDISMSSMAEDLGITATNFEQTYPEAALSVTATTRMVAIWFLAFGALAFLVSLEGYRHGSRWAWYASWVLVVTLIAVGILEIGSPFGIALLVMAAVTLVGGLLARKGLAG